MAFRHDIECLHQRKASFHHGRQLAREHSNILLRDFFLTGAFHFVQLQNTNLTARQFLTCILFVLGNYFAANNGICA